MRVFHCPSCGSSDIDVSSYSAEYMSSTRYDCEDCQWWYKKGRGMGTGSGNKGTHPRSAGSPSGQSTLTETGEWCHTCECCAKPGYCRCVGADDETICESCMDLPREEFEEVREGVESIVELRYTDDALCTECDQREARYKVIT